GTCDITCTLASSHLMNCPSCQTTSQMRGVFISFVVPSFENMVCLLLNKENTREEDNTVVAVRFARTLASCNDACVTSRCNRLNHAVLLPCFCLSLFLPPAVTIR